MNGIRATMNLKSYDDEIKSFRSGQLWLASVYYMNPETGALEEKVRPVIIVGNCRTEDAKEVLVVPCTTQPPRNEFDLLLRYWREIGLFRPTYARVSKVSTIRKSWMIKLISEQLDPRDWEAVHTKLFDIF